MKKYNITLVPLTVDEIITLVVQLQKLNLSELSKEEKEALLYLLTKLEKHGEEIVQVA